MVGDGEWRWVTIGNGKCWFVERINARNLSTTSTLLMHYVSQLHRKHTSLCAVLRLSIFKTMNACNGVVERPADDSWLIAGNVYYCHLWKTTDSVAGVFKCRHRGREHWRAGYLRLKIAVIGNWSMSDWCCTAGVVVGKPEAATVVGWCTLELARRLLWRPR